MNLRLIEEIISRHSPLIDRDLVIAKQEYLSRWDRVQTEMKARGYDLAYACGSELDRSDIAWLAGVYDPIIERYGILIPAEGTPTVVAGSEGGHVIADCLRASGAGLALLREFQISDEDYRFARFEDLHEIGARLAPSRAGKSYRIALLSSPQVIPHDHVNLFVDRYGAEKVVFEEELLQRIKYQKSVRELEIIGAANLIADAAFLGMLAVLKPGIRELEVAAVGDFILKRLGAGRTGFPTIVSSGDRGRSVLGPATNRIVRKNEFVSLGISPAFNGYHGIMRRTVKVGAGLTKEETAFMGALQGLYHTVMKAVQEAASQDVPARIIDQKGKEYLEELKLRDNRGRWMTPREPYTFIHNTGCSECQEGFGAVTPHSREPLGESLALMIDVAFMGFDAAGELVFPVEYAVIEDCFWKRGKGIGVYNRMPLDVQELVGGSVSYLQEENVNPYFRPFKEG